MATELYWDSIDLAVELCNEGLSVGIGEVGRPHWEVDDDVWQEANVILEETMALAKKQNLPLQLHVEGAGASTYADLSCMAERVGLNPMKLIRHHAPPQVDAATCSGIIPSVVVGKGSVEVLIETVSSSEHGFVMETDYMDDQRRPGAVLGPKTVPKRTNALLRAGLDSEHLWNSHQDLPNSIYGD